MDKSQINQQGTRFVITAFKSSEIATDAGLVEIRLLTELRLIVCKMAVLSTFADWMIVGVAC